MARTLSDIACDQLRQATTERLQEDAIDELPQPLREEVIARRARKIERMAEALLCSAVDIADDAAVVQLLQRQGELAADINRYMDVARDRARAISQRRECAS